MPQPIIDPSTADAKFVKGTHSGHLGARERQTHNGAMNDSKMEINNVLSYGLPKQIRGNPLGCGCRVATLSSASPIVDGTIEADYRCHAAWHNYVVFQVRQNANSPENSIKIDKFGNLVEESGVQTAALEEF